MPAQFLASPCRTVARLQGMANWQPDTTGRHDKARKVGWRIAGRNFLQKMQRGAMADAAHCKRECSTLR